MTRYRPLLVVSLLATALVAAPAADAAKLQKPKLFRVALSGKDTADVTKTREVFRPSDEPCNGTVMETRRLTASFGVRPVRSNAQVTSVGDYGFEALWFKARIVSPKYSFTFDTSGGWTRDTSGFDEGHPDPNPNGCAFTHEHKRLGCDWAPRATTRRGVWFWIIPLNGRYGIQAKGGALLDCQRKEDLELIDLAPTMPPPRTKLRQAAVERLTPGKRVRVSGTMPLSHDDDYGNDDEYYLRDRGRESFRYTLTVTRVR